MSAPTACPSCGHDLRTEWQNPDGQTINGSRVIGIYDRDRDRTVAWQCPDCGERWERE